LLQVMATQEKIVKYLDLPIQHCNGEVLRNMNRPGNRQELTDCIAMIREMVPGIVIRTTVMVGFPGETEKQFEELCEFVGEMQFPRLGCFVFSPEEDTLAADMDGQIPKEVGEHRRDVIMQQQYGISTLFAQSLLGTTLPVLVEEYDYEREQFVGRTPFDAPDIDCKVYFTAPAATIGEFMMVTITDLEEFDYIGIAKQEEER
ncbi:MAG: radical SAM protein, partial [Clostridia bacterium]|nr:radical SAM protein [Clostridia bacterium]